MNKPSAFVLSLIADGLMIYAGGVILDRFETNNHWSSLVADDPLILSKEGLRTLDLILTSLAQLFKKWW